MSFLPRDYIAPSSNDNYMKLVDGENKIRILTIPILGWEDWTHEKKPVRFTMENKPARPIDPKKPIRHFWAFVVWNYNDEKIQILQITQASIRNRLEDLCKDEDWGQPFFFDIKIYKKGEGMQTEYNVNPMPHKPLQSHIKQEFMKKRCYLEALFNNDDPFSPEWGSFTEGVFDKVEPKQATIKSDNSGLDVDGYINSFYLDAELMREYSNNIANFNGWSLPQTVAKLREDDELTEKQFKAWKEKQNQVPF
jgi:hypothetical protein